MFAAPRTETGGRHRRILPDCMRTVRRWASMAGGTPGRCAQRWDRGSPVGTNWMVNGQATLLVRWRTHDPRRTLAVSPLQSRETGSAAQRSRLRSPLSPLHTREDGSLAGPPGRTGTRLAQGRPDRLRQHTARAITPPSGKSIHSDARRGRGGLALTMCSLDPDRSGTDAKKRSCSLSWHGQLVAQGRRDKDRPARGLARRHSFAAARTGTAWKRCGGLWYDAAIERWIQAQRATHTSPLELARSTACPLPLICHPAPTDARTRACRTNHAFSRPASAPISPRSICPGCSTASRVAGSMCPTLS